MALIKIINTNIGIIANYHSIYWYQGISFQEKDEVRTIIKSYASKEAYFESKQSVEQTELSFELQKDFNGNIRTEIYNKAKELEKFKDAEDDI